LHRGNRVLGGAVQHFHLQAIACSRRAVEIVGVGNKRQRLARLQARRRRIQHEFQPLRQELLDPERKASDRLGSVRIKPIFQRPPTGGCIGGNLALVAVVTQRLGGERRGGDQATVGL